MKRHGTAETVKILLSTLTLFACAPAAKAGDDAGVAVAEAMTVTPAAFAPAVLMPNAQVPPAPPALDAPARSAAAVKSGVAAGEAEEGDAAAQPEPVRLTAAQPWKSDVAYLVFTGADTVHPESSVSLPAGPEAQAALRFKVEKGGAYLVDFSVIGVPGGSYALGADSVEREVEDSAGLVRHVVTAVNAVSAGWVTLRLSRRETGFHLYAAEISRLR